MRFLILGGLAAIAVLAFAWSAIAADEDEGDRSGAAFEIPVPPPPPGAEDERIFRFGHGRPEVLPAPDELRRRGPHGAMLLAPPPGPGGPLGGELTWGEFHVQRDGEEVVMRVDHGELASVGEDSITVAENDGNEVEIPIDGDTEVIAPPFGGPDSVDELEQGSTVHVSREEGEAADVIGVLPEKLPPLPERDGR